MMAMRCYSQEPLTATSKTVWRFTGASETENDQEWNQNSKRCQYVCWQQCHNKWGFKWGVNFNASSLKPLWTNRSFEASNITEFGPFNGGLINGRFDSESSDLTMSAINFNLGGVAFLNGDGQFVDGAISIDGDIGGAESNFWGFKVKIRSRQQQCSLNNSSMLDDAETFWHHSRYAFL